MRTLVLIAATLLVSASTGARAELIIDSCGVTVPRGETGRLSQDLQCTAGGTAVVLERGARLELDGHTLSSDNDPLGYGVLCVDRSCQVLGPGTLSGFERAVNAGTNTASVRIAVKDVDMLGNGSGIAAGEYFNQRTAVRVSNSTIDGRTNSPIYGVAAGRIRAENVTVRHHQDGFLAQNVFIGSNVVVEENSGRGIGTSGEPSSRIRGENLQVRANGGRGVSSLRVNLANSTVVDNVGVDIFSAHPPKLRDVVCGTSQGLGGTSWGVCTAD